MIRLPKPASFVGDVFAGELASAGLAMSARDVYVDADGVVVVGLPDEHAAAVESLLSAHDPSSHLAEPTLADRLAAVEAELRALRELAEP